MSDEFANVPPIDGGYNHPLVKEADPELERLLHEEDAIEAGFNDVDVYDIACILGHAIYCVKLEHTNPTHDNPSKIPAIKHLRTAKVWRHGYMTGLGLMDAKECIDWAWDQPEAQPTEDEAWLREQIEDLKTTIASRDEQIAGLRRDNQRLVRENDLLDTEKAGYADEIHDYTCKINRLEDDVEHLSDTLHGMAIDAQEYEHTIVKLAIKLTKDGNL